MVHSNPQDCNISDVSEISGGSGGLLIKRTEQQEAENEPSDVGIPGDCLRTVAHQRHAHGDQDIADEPEENERHDRAAAKRSDASKDEDLRWAGRADPLFRVGNAKRQAAPIRPEVIDAGRSNQQR